MFAFILILLMLIIASSKAAKKNEFNKEYISKDGTLPIKGIFVALVILSHAKGYFSGEMTGLFDKAYTATQAHLGQMIVAMFLFYSGYGIMEQIKKREFPYVKSIMTRRFPNLLLNYDIAVVFYIILVLCLKLKPPVWKVFLSFTAWDTVGNSSWFIFVTLVLYVFTFISFLPLKKIKSKYYHIAGIAILTGLSVLLVFILVLTKTDRQPWWYNTVMLYPLGFWYSYLKNGIEKLVMRNDATYLITAALLTVAYISSYLSRDNGYVSYFVFGAVFVLCVTLLTMKIEIKSNVLNWFGEHVFSIYILQRIPMMIMDNMGLAKEHRYLFVVLSIAITCAMAELYDRFYAWLSAKIWKPKTQ